MFQVKYVGPRVIISHHGISFLKAKEDKYIYLMTALEILKDIDNDYTVNEQYTHMFTHAPLKEEQLHHVLKQYEQGLEDHITEEYTACQKKIEHEIHFVQNQPQLNQEEKEVWIKNIKLMHPYRIQRTINKIYYEHCIKNIRKLLIHHKIKTLRTSLDKNFFHVLNSLKGVLITGKPSFDASVTESLDDAGKMILTLHISG